MDLAGLQTDENYINFIGKAVFNFEGEADLSTDWEDANLLGKDMFV